MKECSKSLSRRLHDSTFSNRFFVGQGIDIGGKPDPLVLYKELFPRMESCRTWDREDGDAQFLETVANNSYDFVHSSHCLEHLVDPQEGLKNWFRILRPNGHLIVTIPDEDLYEQGLFPSTFNKDHKKTFTIHKQNSWCPQSVNVLDLITALGDEAQIIKIELILATYRFGLPRFDQTMTPVGESAIEFVIRKRASQELARRGQRTFPSAIDREIRIHLNQYRDDKAMMKASALTNPPFLNDSEIQE
jgi:SAM-dependent methyltransferase